MYVTATIKHKYYYSEKLKLRFRQHGDGIMFEDKVIYSQSEIDVLKESGANVVNVHKAKKMFYGKIIT